MAMLGYATPATVLVLAMMPVIGMIDAGIAKAGLPLPLHRFERGDALRAHGAIPRHWRHAGRARARAFATNVDAVARIHGLGDLALAWRIHRPAIAPV